MRRALLWAPAVGVMAVIFAASSVPGSQIPGTIWDKLAHMLVYGALGAALVLPLSGGRASGVTPGVAAGAIVLALAYGVSDEIHQHFTPGRTPDALDVVADTAGAAAGSAAAYAAAAIARRWRASAAVR